MNITTYNLKAKQLQSNKRLPSLDIKNPISSHFQSERAKQKRLNSHWDDKKNQTMQQFHTMTSLETKNTDPFYEKYLMKSQLCDKLQEDIGIYKNQIQFLEHKIKLLEAKLSMEPPSARKLEEEFKVHQKKLEDQISKLTIANYENLDKMQSFNHKAKQLHAETLHMQHLLKCKYCNKMVSDAITIIPCAHTYCRQCKQGYTKKCYICGDDNRIEAIYCNEYMIQIVKMYETISDMIQLYINH